MRSGTVLKMSLLSMLNTDAEGEPAYENSWFFPENVLPGPQDQLGGLDIEALLHGHTGGDPDGPSADYTALDQIDGGVTLWASHLGDGYSERMISDDSDGQEGPDIEMASDVDAIHDNIAEGEDLEMTDDDEKVCYGMLHGRDVVLKNPEMNLLNAKLWELADSNHDHVQKFILTVKPAPHILLSLPDGTQFGILRDDMTKVLEPLLNQSSPFELEAVATTRRLREQINMASKPNEAIVQVSINIYGPRDRAKEVGDKLSDERQWLQKPDFSKPQYPYSNPHILHFPEIDSGMVDEEFRKDVSAAAKPRAEEERVQRLVAQVHQALTRANELDNMAGDQRLKTSLLKHQQQALSYMYQRESGGIPEKYRLWKKEMHAGQEMFIHRITKTRSHVRPDEMGGGVLADEMGMGKTLSTLALMMQTLEAGQKWAGEKRNEEHTNTKTQRHTHSTLVIVPSALLINNWLNEIKMHTGDTLRIVKHHGQGRERDLSGLDALENSDLVITTYNTLATEFASKKAPSLLHKIYWYRIVLDEAHIIRRPSTTFFRACADLEARSRWCLTGTPIQNRLEDIGALFAFLRAEPFHSLAQFRRFICIPFDQGETVARDRLILLYDSLVLRRTTDILNLPGVDWRPRTLTLSDEEKRQYDKTSNILNRYVRTQVNHYHGGSTHAFDTKPTKFGLFQAQLQLRILCNHGTWQKQFSWKKRDAREDRLAERQALVSEMGLRSELMCDGCRQPRPILGSSQAQNNFVEDCNHSLCHECLEDCSDMKHCPLCVRFAAKEDVSMQDGGGEPKAATDQDGNPHHKDYFNSAGCSTKMSALMEDVKEHLEDTNSIIFSCWTRTLDLIAKHLRAEKINFVRVDGEVLVSKRQGIIDSFAKDKTVRVLLMTTGTGAFGLNLTAANRIFIIEPQWNPSVENQAVARAIRLQQEKKVLVTRYIMQGTVEEQMLSQQIRKRERAEFGFVRRQGEENAVANPELGLAAEDIQIEVTRVPVVIPDSA